MFFIIFTLWVVIQLHNVSIGEKNLLIHKSNHCCDEPTIDKIEISEMEFIKICSTIDQIVPIRNSHAEDCLRKPGSSNDNIYNIKVSSIVMHLHHIFY